ncbi:MAG: DNA-3-methyladenine glycosylase [Acidobacteria bacterium]|nr:MAG: DNA-3-methyladenine glycosylase [Acidobacteriota bacterium]
MSSADRSAGSRLSRRFFRRDAVTVARSLLGRLLVRHLPDGTVLAGRIVETEAYLGPEDRAAHSFGGRRTPRNESMYKDAGHAYVYFIYGMHWCLNVVAASEGRPEACLIRAVEPITGLETMRRLRAGRPDPELCSGPAKLTQAFAIDGSLDGIDLVTSRELYLAWGRPLPPNRIAVGPRIGVAYAGEWADKPLRFYDRQSRHVSRR